MALETPAPTGRKTCCNPEVATCGCGQPKSAGCCAPETCGCGAASDAEDVRELVREKYGAVAEGRSTGCGCANPGDTDAALDALGYSDEQRALIPEGANLGLGCGNPIAHAALEAGEVVLDLGSGAGIDCFLAARAVGPTGRAIGVDMTEAMVERARANATRHGDTNVEFRLGEIERLPVSDASVDVIISNCVINLSPDKAQVFREAHRVLKPGGRMLVSDLVLEHALPPQARQSLELYVGCVAGASLKHDYLALARAAGFADVAIVEERPYVVGRDALAPGSPERLAFESVRSVKVRAVRR